MPTCFIVMPISMPEALLANYRNDADHFPHVLDHLFVPALKKAGFDPVSPKAEGAEVIHARIIKKIEQADLVLRDMSTLNPNVFFELGIRTAIDKPVCMVVDDLTKNVPFDTSLVNYHRYDGSLDAWTLDEEVGKLASHVAASIAGGVENPMWHYFGLSAKAELAAKEGGIEARIELISLQLAGLAREFSESRRANELPWGARAKMQSAARSDTIAMVGNLLEADGVRVLEVGPREDALQMVIDGVPSSDVSRRAHARAALAGFPISFIVDDTASTEARRPAPPMATPPSFRAD